MKKDGFQVVFFGTPDFSVPSLKALLKSHHRVKLVVTQPDRPKGRGKKMALPPVKKAALEAGVRISQPVSVNTSNFLQALSDIGPELFVVVAFGQIFSEKLLQIPALGAINVHASLLPRYRGAAPIQRVIINGEPKTGVTTMLMQKGLDSGDILLSAETQIGPCETAGTLHDRLADSGANVLIDTLDKLEKGNLEAKPQDHTKATYAPILKKKDGHIDWSQPAYRIESFIRGMNPWPGAFTVFNHKRLKIFKTREVPGEKNAYPGTVIECFSEELRVAAGDGTALTILELQSESGKRLSIRDFLRGHPISLKSVLS
jgi:methionyl-tRNA formyltransferase